MKVYIAGPFFNAMQGDILSHIETFCAAYDMSYYSPRRDSGSAELSPGDRATSEAWIPVIQSNIQNLYSCDIVIAVLEYAMPEYLRLVPGMSTTQHMGNGKTKHWWDVPPNATPIEIPDSGTVWECGAAHILNKPTFGFRRTESKKRNLMLSHTMNGCVIGYANLERFIREIAKFTDAPTSHRLAPRFTGEIE